MRCFRGGLTLSVLKIPFRVFSSSWGRLSENIPLERPGKEEKVRFYAGAPFGPGS